MSEWISVAVRLPEHTQKVLGVVDLGDDGRCVVIAQRLYQPWGERYWADDGEEITDSEGARVTHWMPMPDMP